MAPDINNPGGVKNDPDEIRDGVVSDATRFPGGFIDQRVTEAGAPVQIVGQFQINNASFINSFDVSSQEPTPLGLTFKPDGTQLYVIGEGTDSVYQYGLSTAFDVSTASFVRSFNVGARHKKPHGLTFKPDGSQLSVVGRGFSKVSQYSLSTAFDVSTASFVRSFDVSTQDGFPQGLAFRPDGSQLYVIGEGNDNVYQYSLSTAFDVSTASFVRSLDISPQDSLPQGLTFRPDGSQMYIIGQSNDNVYQYDLSTAYDISTASFVRSFDVSSQDSRPTEVAFKPDGSQLYVTGDGSDKVYQFTVGFIGAEFG